MPKKMHESLKDFDWESFAKEAEAAAGDEGRALAENMARNLTESVRQPRNALEAAVDTRKTEAEISDATGLDVAPQTRRNLQASFETHLRALFRRTADALARELKAQTFFGFTPDGSSPVKMGFDEYHADDLPNLGPHPHSELLAVPVPAEYEPSADLAARLAILPLDVQKDWLARYRKAIETDDEIPPIPAP
ncbi:MAG: hypothetical protein KIS92_00865 [Planctomycetota bacterium]|nr:hypothetical protein [Planctomycetota bacterium]